MLVADGFGGAGVRSRAGNSRSYAGPFGPCCPIGPCQGAGCTAARPGGPCRRKKAGWAGPSTENGPGVGGRSGSSPCRELVDRLVELVGGSSPELDQLAIIHIEERIRGTRLPYCGDPVYFTP